MNPIPVMTGVIVSNEKHDFHGLAGHVHGYIEGKPELVQVKFDVDGEVADMKLTDIKVL